MTPKRPQRTPSYERLLTTTGVTPMSTNQEDRLKRDTRELAFSIVDMITDYLDNKDYDESEEAAVVVNAVLMLTSFPLEFVPPSKRMEIIELFSDFSRRQMDAFNQHLRKENHEGN